MLEGLIDEFQEGFELDNCKIYAAEVYDGRVSKQRYLDIFVSRNNREKELCILSIYPGKRPHYHPWVEMFKISDDLGLGGECEKYFGSTIEEMLLDKFSSYLRGGGRIFIEYGKDEETRYGLSRGYPAVVTRLGYLLFKRDFTWFKDWYFAEGFNEGNQKLQGEKPLDEEHKQRHLQNIEDEIVEFQEDDKRFESDIKLEKARRRVDDILSSLYVG